MFSQLLSVQYPMRLFSLESNALLAITKFIKLERRRRERGEGREVRIKKEDGYLGD